MLHELLHHLHAFGVVHMQLCCWDGILVLNHVPAALPFLPFVVTLGV